MSTLTTVYANNYIASLITQPPVKLDVQQHYGRVRHLYDKYTQATGDAFGTSGLINMMTLLIGMRLVDAINKCAATGATGQYEIGWAADAAAVEAADPDGIFTTQDPGAAAVGAHMLQSVPGWQKQFTANVVVQVDWTEAQADNGTGAVELALFVVID